MSDVGPKSTREEPRNIVKGRVSTGTGTGYHRFGRKNFLKPFEHMRCLLTYSAVSR